MYLNEFIQDASKLVRVLESLLKVNGIKVNVRSVGGADIGSLPSLFEFTCSDVDIADSIITKVLVTKNVSGSLTRYSAYDMGFVRKLYDTFSVHCGISYPIVQNNIINNIKEKYNLQVDKTILKAKSTDLVLTKDIDRLISMSEGFRLNNMYFIDGIFYQVDNVQRTASFLRYF